MIDSVTLEEYRAGKASAEFEILEKLKSFAEDYGATEISLVVNYWQEEYRVDGGVKSTMSVNIDCVI